MLVQSGADFKIHPDQVRQWKNVGGTITQEFLVPILLVFGILLWFQFVSMIMDHRTYPAVCKQGL